MSIKGMNVEWGDQAASQLSSEASQVRDVITKVNRVRQESQTEWKGEDQQAFAGWYDGEGKKALENVAMMLSNASDSVRRNAADQRAASR